jgi:hypothetical protein
MEAVYNTSAKNTGEAVPKLQFLEQAQVAFFASL